MMRSSEIGWTDHSVALKAKVRCCCWWCSLNSPTASSGSRNSLLVGSEGIQINTKEPSDMRICRFWRGSVCQLEADQKHPTSIKVSHLLPLPAKPTEPELINPPLLLRMHNHHNPVSWLPNPFLTQQTRSLLWCNTHYMVILSWFVYCSVFFSLLCHLMNLYSPLRLNCCSKKPLDLLPPLLKPPMTGFRDSPSWTTWQT